MYHDLPEQLARDKQATATVDELVIGNIKLAVHIAKSYSITYAHITHEDLIQEGIMGLREAAIRYKSDKGASFGTYASYWIKQRIMRFIEYNYSLVRVPYHMFEKKRKSRKYDRQAEDAMHGVFSIDIESDSEAKFDIEDTRAEKPSDIMENNEYYGMVRSIMHRELSSRECAILMERFNLNNEYDRPPTLGELGERFNITRERVRQIEEEALGKLKRKLSLTKNT